MSYFVISIEYVHDLKVENNSFSKYKNIYCYKRFKKRPTKRQKIASNILGENYMDIAQIDGSQKTSFSAEVKIS